MSDSSSKTLGFYYLGQSLHKLQHQLLVEGVCVCKIKLSPDVLSTISKAINQKSLRGRNTATNGNTQYKLYPRGPIPNKH